MPAAVAAATEALLRHLAPQALGALLRRERDFAACEDAVQEALLAAAQQWPDAGMPTDPLRWLVAVARRRLLDQVRADIARRQREAVQAALDPDTVVEAPDPVDDGALHAEDTLLLLFLCCHPALPTTAAIALTLRAVGGLSTAEIARAFLVPLPTMAQRISRAKAQIAADRLRFEWPEPSDRQQRLSAVQQVLYLMFNEGYTCSAGPALLRVDLCHEAIRLVRELARLVPDDAETTGLLALLLLTDARRAARSDALGSLVPLDEQDRTLWDARLIAEGSALAQAAWQRGPVGEYQLLAAIAALHDAAPSTGATDWPQILALYTALLQIRPHALVALNQSVAVAMVHGPALALAMLDQLSEQARGVAGHRLPAVRAHLLERNGERLAAIDSYHEAARRADNLPERDFLLLRAARLAAAAVD